MNNNYPKQTYDPLRREIATETIQKELRKLLPSVPEDLWSKLDQDVENWFEGKKSELAEVHDFWNGFEGVTQGFKLKSILPYLTAANIKWQETDVPVGQVIFTTNLPIMAFLAEAPFNGQMLIDFIADKKNNVKIQEIIEDSERHAHSSAPRDHYRIIVLKKGDDYFLLDGHRRVIRAIIKKQKIISAYIGEYISGQTPKNYWVSTGFLRNLKRLVDFDPKNKKLIESVDYILEKLSSEHENVAYILPKRVKDHKSV